MVVNEQMASRSGPYDAPRALSSCEQKAPMLVEEALMDFLHATWEKRSWARSSVF